LEDWFMSEKPCSKCGVTKPLTDYSTNGERHRRPECRQCRRRQPPERTRQLDRERYAAKKRAAQQAAERRPYEPDPTDPLIKMVQEERELYLKRKGAA
jgi:hypothetical protein